MEVILMYHEADAILGHFLMLALGLYLKHLCVKCGSWITKSLNRLQPLAAIGLTIGLRYQPACSACLCG